METTQGQLGGGMSDFWMRRISWRFWIQRFRNWALTGAYQVLGVQLQQDQIDVTQVGLV